MGISVNLGNFGQTYTTRKAARTLSEYLLNNIGEDTVTYLIHNNKQIKDYIPADKIPIVQAKLKEYKWFIDTVTVQNIVDELPRETKEFFSGITGGIQWLRTQLTWIKSLSK